MLVHLKGIERKRRRGWGRETKTNTTHKRKQRRQRSSIRDDSMEPLYSGSQAMRRRHQPNRCSSRDGYGKRRRYQSSRGVDERRCRRNRKSRDRGRSWESRSKRQTPPLFGLVSTSNAFDSDYDSKHSMLL